MDTFQVLPVSPVLASVPLEMPVNILLALPEYMTRDPQAPRNEVLQFIIAGQPIPEHIGRNPHTAGFNLPAAVARLFRRFGWESAVKVLNPHIWAPGWDDNQLRAFVMAPSPFNETWPLPDLPVESLRVPDFPGSGALADIYQPNYPQFDIIHFSGYIVKGDSNPALYVEGWAMRGMSAGALRDALVAARTRLLILHVPVEQFHDAERLAECIVGGGGPAVLVVIAFANPDRYFFNLYASIVHNRPLPQVAEPENWELGLRLRLLYGEGGDGLLQFDQWLEMLRARSTEAQTRAQSYSQNIRDMRSRMTRYLHRSQTAGLEPRIRSIEGPATSLEFNISSKVGEVAANLDWARESGGAEPTARIAEVVPQIEAEAQELADRYPQLYQELENDLNAQAARAPRVLNANFANPDTHRVLEPRHSLSAGREYDLLVDVGPRWNTLPSIVIGNADFPEQALPPDQDGYVVQVVVVSDDFSPRLVSADIWVPRRTGRSFPYRNGQKAERSGPVALRLRAPVIPENSDANIIPARARLCFYYENNLLQSAVVKVGVTRSGDVRLNEDNAVDVDYVLTSTFQEVRERYARREVQFTPNEESMGHPVAVNLTLNDDGADGHRILVKQHNEMLPAWTPFDPKAADKALQDAREELLNCFWQRDAAGQFVLDGMGNRVSGLGQNNGKSREQFSRDLFYLAQLGHRFYKMVIGQAEPEGDSTPVQWGRALSKALAQSGIVQVARTGPAQYVFPWALLYVHPMPGSISPPRWCDILQKWSKDGICNEPVAKSCPFVDEPWHQEDVLCPYGFWGLRHIVEQPLSALRKRNGSYVLRDATNQIAINGPISFAAGRTRDTQLDAARLEAHLTELAKLEGVRFTDPQPNPADELNAVRALMTKPALVYFVCHCEFDAGRDEPYLAVGLRDNQPSHRIYPATVEDWALTEKSPNMAAWSQQRPLVFINGCHTADLKPGNILNFVTAFALAGASGVIGTEVSVQLPLATEIAESLLRKITRKSKPVSVGQAIREVRWELTNKGNLLGLAYTFYSLADLHISSSGQP
jgi:hypothetical protein